MAVLFTLMGRITDWKALQRFNRETMLSQAREAGATRYQIYRNAHDASQLLIVAELPDHDALAEIGEALSRHLAPLLDDGTVDEQVWEPTNSDSMG